MGSGKLLGVSARVFGEESINSPFRYPGGKFYATKFVLEHIPDHDYYIEPFAGGASIFFAKRKARQNSLNDLDGDLINVYTTIRDQPLELAQLLQGESASKARHAYYKNEFKPSNDLERAARWYYLNRTSYSGIMKLENCYWGYGDKYSMRPAGWPRRIFQCSKKLQGVELTNYDFEEV